MFMGGIGPPFCKTESQDFVAIESSRCKPSTHKFLVVGGSYSLVRL